MRLVTALAVKRACLSPPPLLSKQKVCNTQKKNFGCRLDEGVKCTVEIVDYYCLMSYNKKNGRCLCTYTVVLSLIPTHFFLPNALDKTAASWQPVFHYTSASSNKPVHLVEVIHMYKKVSHFQSTSTTVPYTWWEGTAGR